MSGDTGVDPAAALGEVLDALAARGFPRAEVYAKRGRSRVVEETPAGVTVSYHREEGWAARAGDDRRSLFATGTGAPSPAGPGGGWPEADGDGLELPEPGAAAPAAEERPWRDPPDLDAPLAGERDAMGLAATLREELAAELPEARLLRVRLADGASEWDLASRLEERPGVAVAGRGRVALLRVEAALPAGAGGAGGPPPAASLDVAVREARSFDARALARRIADRLSVAAAGRAPERDRAALLLAPPVVVRLLAGLLPLFLGARGVELVRRLEDRDGRLAARAVHVVDDGRLPGGVLAASHDGEGLPTSAVRLVEAGIFRQPLLSWRDAGTRSGRGAGRPAGRPSGCARRPSWRDLPRAGPSHLFLTPDPQVGVAALLEGLARGYYLIDTDGPVTVDLAEGRLSLPGVGFTVERGRAAAPLAGATVEGSVGSFLRSVEAVARDLTFYPLAGGMLGAPTVLVTGLEIRSG